MLRHEIGMEMKRQPTLTFNALNMLQAGKFDESCYQATREYLTELNGLYAQKFSVANQQREKLVNHFMSTDARKFNHIKDAYFNESIADIARKVFEKNKMLRDGDKLIQVIDPIYQMPEPDGFFSFRTHFFAPMKYFAGRYWETLWFNISMVWVLTVGLYVLLYYDVLRKIFDLLGELKLKKK